MRLSIYPTLLVLFFLVSGCAHKKLVSAGDDYLGQGKYQYAVEKYQKALKEKPNDAKTLDKYNQARALFDTWLNKLEFSAQQAEKNQHLAKAQLLYAKLAKHRNNDFYKDKQLALKQANLNEYGLKIHLTVKQPQLKQVFHQELEHITFINHKANNKPNEIDLSFSLSKATFDLKQRVEMNSEEYISGYETIVNPDYQNIQHDIVDYRADIKESRQQLHALELIANAQNRDLQLVVKDLKIVELTLEKTKVNTSEYYGLIQQEQVLKKQLKKQQQLNDKNVKKIAKIEKKITKKDRRLDDLFHLLEATPELADIAVYSDYQYPITITDQIIKAQLEMQVNGNAGFHKERQYSVQAINQSRSHKAHQRIGLKNKAKKLSSEQQLKQILNTKVRRKILNLISLQKSEYQQTLISNANISNEIAQKLNLRLIAAIISRKSVPSYTHNQMQQQLKNEFGHGGSFLVDELLNISY